MARGAFDVIGLGASTIDVINLVDHFPDNEEVQEAQALVIDGGGPISTAIVTLSRLGAKVAMLDAVGDDWWGGQIIHIYEMESVCTDYVRIRGGSTSSISTILVRRDDGARTIIHKPGTAPTLTLEEVSREVIASTRMLHLNGRHWDACIRAIKLAREEGVKISFDGGAHRFTERHRQLVPLTDICIVSRHYANQYTRISRPERAANALMAEGPDLVVITDGAMGSWVLQRGEEVFHQSAFPVQEVVDTTGAGDVYHGVFLFGLLHAFDLSYTASLASAAAAWNCQHLGGRKCARNRRK
ncbi:MAG: carbohydrate kinase [Anaerolineales bacterium]|nr:carbohydrate kinase [Anaerolineales bacterium]